jgi:cytochrome b561
MADETTYKYDRLAKTLHWLIGVLVIMLLLGGNLMAGLPEAEKPAIAMIHSGIGTVILLLMILRLYWRISHPPPALLPAPAWQQAASRLVHWGFYVLVILQPIFGYAQARYTSFDVVPFGLVNVTSGGNDALYETFHELHEVTASLIIVFLLVHAGAALFHHLIKKDAVLKRMTWGNVRPAEAD